MERQENNLIEKLETKFHCPKDFKCYRSRFAGLCNAKVLNSGKYLECIDDDAPNCIFSLLQNNLYLCKCPLRIYLAKEWNM